MEAKELKSLYGTLPATQLLRKALDDEGRKNVCLAGLSASSTALVMSAAVDNARARTLLFIMRDEEEAGYLYNDLHRLTDDETTLLFPSGFRRAVRYGQRDAANEILRTEVVTRLNSRQATTTLIVTHAEAVTELVAGQQQVDNRLLKLEVGQNIAVNTITHTLQDYGFTEVDYVYEPGQYATRGSIVDVFSYSHEYPFRIDFFGDDIDSIRTFEIETQLSREQRKRADIVPEMTPSADSRDTLLAFLPSNAVIIARDFDYVHEVAQKTYAAGFSEQAKIEMLEGASEAERYKIEQQMRSEIQLATGTRIAKECAAFRRITLAEPHNEETDVIRFNTQPQPLFHKNFALLTQVFADYQSRGYRIYVMADSRKQNERIRDIIDGETAKGKDAEMYSPIQFTPVDYTLHEGFVDHDLHACFFTDHQIFDRFHKYNLKSDRARSGKMALTLKEIQQFEIGDYVVHVDHGIGRFGGLVRMPIEQGGYQEMIKITYNRGDSIYVSIHALYKVSKYKSQDGGPAPRLSTLGTGQWERLKERTKTHIKDIARDLIRLYAERRHARGFAFSHDTYLQQALEASFIYEDTPDQLRATQDVKADMERQQPMDRLVCGDVGFGKTEVAVRAAFKAASDSKQVAVLVPTTVLAYQHYRTFTSRLKDMPVRVDYLTRARNAKQTRQVLQDLAEGKIDIIIGTHKLIGKTVKFHDLGLLIIDEEQKFGVSTKEKLRQMKTNVDTLTMSATPIPRTLQFSLVGARDLSVIQTPPPNRYPIQTEIHTFSADIIAEAVSFELSRNGQVYFVNNRINELQHIKHIIEQYVPDARVAVGHGQMPPDELEQIILDFSNHDYDVLLSTTIVENGIDIPNANTIIINGAHYFGLSDLHQMRGRVGRGNRKAFCYLLAPPLSALPQDSRRRLEALENFSALGSGINIAMQDLDIRGAGNMLGAEQSGFISDLGYETYQKILNEAMAELRNESPVDEPATTDAQTAAKHSRQPNAAPTANHQTSPLPDGLFVADCTLESDLEIYFPEQFVPSDSERMLLYRELDNIRDEQALEAYRNRLIDRFGKLPATAEELLAVVSLRRYGKMLGCEKIGLKQQKMMLYFVSNPHSPFYQSDAFGAVLDYIGRNIRRCNLREQNGKRSMVVTNIASVADAVKVLKKILNPSN